MAEQRIQKVLADQGICSRREAERLIAAGKVKVNGHPVTLGDKMDPDYDKVMIDGQTQRIVRKRQYTYIMLHKPLAVLVQAAHRAQHGGHIGNKIHDGLAATVVRAGRQIAAGLV